MDNKIYYEEGGRWLVEVLDDNTQDEMRNKIKLLDVPKDSKIMCECSDGSNNLIFRHIDGMYSFCVTEKGNVVHLYCMTELSLQPDGLYKIEDDSLLHGD